MPSGRESREVHFVLREIHSTLWRPSLVHGSMTLVRAAFFAYKGRKEGGGVGVYSERGEVKSVVLPRVPISRHGRIRYSVPNFLR